MSIDDKQAELETLVKLVQEAIDRCEEVRQAKRASDEALSALTAKVGGSVGAAIYSAQHRIGYLMTATAERS